MALMQFIAGGFVLLLMFGPFALEVWLTMQQDRRERRDVIVDDDYNYEGAAAGQMFWATLEE
jgi:hypothetical protein